MNTSNDNNPKENNPVHTPTPPQVMDPSQLPKGEDQKEKGRRKSSEVKKPSDKNKEGNEKLAPNEEL